MCQPPISVRSSSARRSGARRSTPSDVGDVIMGCVLQAGAGMNVARQAALESGRAQRRARRDGQSRVRIGTSGRRSCRRSDAHGLHDLVVAGGTESMSSAPYLLQGARWGYRMGNAEAFDSILTEGLTCAMQGCHMGMTAEEIVDRFGVSRADQDAFAAESQRRAEQAIARRFLQGRDRSGPHPAAQGRPCGRSRPTNIPRSGTTEEKLAALKPAFKKDGTRHRRQRLGYQRRRRGDGRRQSPSVPGAWDERRWRGSSPSRRPALIRRSWGWVRSRPRGKHWRAPVLRPERSICSS